MTVTALPGAPPGAPPDVLPDVHRIAVLRANAIGDWVMALPAVSALRAAYPAAEVTLVGAPWHAAFLRGRPGPVDDVVVLPRVPGMGGTAADAPPAEDLPAVLDGLRGRRFDLAVQIHGGGAQSNPLVRSFGARTAIGLRADGAEGLDADVPYRYYQPEVERYLEVVALAGAHPVPGGGAVAVTDRDRAEAAGALGPVAGPLVALHPGATDPRRQWPPERFAEVATALAAGGATVVVTGTGGEAELVERVVGAGPARGLAGELSLGGLAGLYSRCDLVVSNDTGPLHLARAVGAATIGLYWCGNAINAGPATRARHRALLSWTVHCPECGLDCTRDLYRHRPGDGCDHRPSFLADVPVAEVLDEARDLLSPVRPGPILGP